MPAEQCRECGNNVCTRAEELATDDRKAGRATWVASRTPIPPAVSDRKCCLPPNCLCQGDIQDSLQRFPDCVVVELQNLAIVARCTAQDVLQFRKTKTVFQEEEGVVSCEQFKSVG